MKVVRLKPLLLAVFGTIIFCSYVLYCFSFFFCLYLFVCFVCFFRMQTGEGGGGKKTFSSQR